MQKKGGAPGRSGTWARHVHQIRLAQQLIRMMSKGQGAQGGDDEDNEDDCSDISQAENLLESYFAQVPCSCLYLQEKLAHGFHPPACATGFNCNPLLWRFGISLGETLPCTWHISLSEAQTWVRRLISSSTA